MIVLGAGAVGVELAQAYSELGSTVTLLEVMDRLLAQEEPFAGEQLLAALRERGIDVRLGAQVSAVRRDDASVTVQFSDGDAVVADEILVATGRRPRTDDLGLETVGLEPGASIEVNETIRVANLPWLFALGDVNGRALLTHAGKYQAHVAAEAIDGRRARATMDTGGVVPRVVFTEPQVAAVGLTLRAARERGLNALAYDVPSSITAGASFHGRDTPGTSRLVVDEDRGLVVGATFTGTDVAEWLHAATIAIAGEVPVERLWDAIPAFPTRSEIWLRLLERRRAGAAR